MRKIIFIITLFFVTPLIAQKGYWLCKNYKVIDSTQGWRVGQVGLIIDFNNSKLRHLLKDTIIDVNINKSQNKIWFNNDTDTINYSIKNSEIEFKEDNIINVFHPFKFKKDLNFSEEEVSNLLIRKRIKPIQDSLRISFRASKIKGHPNSKARIFQTIYSDRDLFFNFWFLEKINNNLFLCFYTEFEPHEINYHRVLEINKKYIELEPIIEYPRRPKLRRLEFIEY
jgi:hypothetical protein